MSEVDPVEVSTTRAARFSEKTPNKEADDSSAQLERRKNVEREGLPAGYRMRADAHYVEQLTARSADLPVRWIPIDEIDSGGFTDGLGVDDLRPLVQSIGEHGIVQPLLVRRDAGQYRLITGRKRLAAARGAGLSRLPCLVHQVDDARADALARADNLHLEASPARNGPALDRDVVNVIRSVSEAVSTIGSAAALMTGHGSAMSKRVTVDLVKAEAWRAAWQLRATAILYDLYEWRYRPVLIAPLLEMVRENFAAESRLSGIGLKLNILDWNASSDGDEEGLVCGITGTVLAVAGLVGETGAAEIAVVARASAGKASSIDVAQETTSVSTAVAARLLDGGWSDRPGGWAAALGISVAKAVARHHGGDLLYVPRDGRGCTVRLTLGR